MGLYDLTTQVFSIRILFLQNHLWFLLKVVTNYTVISLQIGKFLYLGQIYEIASMFYGLDSINVTVLESINDNPGSTTGPLQLDPKPVIVKYRLDFDNRDYV